MKFVELDLVDPILRAVEYKGYENPTPIQEQAIPVVLENNDILGIAQTGTGKTAAFAIPIIQSIYKLNKNRSGKPRIQALIVTPTRELAIQIDDNIRDYNKYTNLRHSVIFGGVKQGKQVDTLRRGVHILTATPGRLLDLINQGFISLNDLKIFVLDEADRMLDMGFIHDVKKLIKIIPRKRQTLFFSATMPENIISLSKSILTDPVRIEIAVRSSPTENVEQSLYYVDKTNKLDLLIHLLEDNEGQVLLFSRTKHGADKLVRKLSKAGHSAVAIHGNKTQNQRQKALKSFKEGKRDILVATDIAARGIDIKSLELVINYNIPNVAETYVHRIGRSGRAGEKGNAITIVEGDENKLVKPIEKLMGKSIPVVKEHPFPQTRQTYPTSSKNGSGSGSSDKPKSRGNNSRNRKYRGRRR